MISHNNCVSTNTINCGPTGGPSKPNVDINEKTPEGSTYEPHEVNVRALEINLDLKSLYIPMIQEKCFRSILNCRSINI